MLTEHGPPASVIHVPSRRDSKTYFADPVSSRARPLSNFAMSASSSDEVLTPDKRAGDVMGKKPVRRLFDVQPTFIFILAQVRVMPATVMVGSDIAASRVPSRVTKHKSRLTCGG